MEETAIKSYHQHSQNQELVFLLMGSQKGITYIQSMQIPFNLLFSSSIIIGVYAQPDLFFNEDQLIFEKDYKRGSGDSYNKMQRAAVNCLTNLHSTYIDKQNF